MQPFVAHRSATQVDAGTVGSFATTWTGSECVATGPDATPWRFSVAEWAQGQAYAYRPNEDQPIGAYQRRKSLSYDGHVTFGGEAYDVSHSGRFQMTYLLKRGDSDVMSLAFKAGYSRGDTVEGSVDPELDPGLALFFVWLVYAFRNEDIWLASAPPAMS